MKKNGFFRPLKDFALLFNVNFFCSIFFTFFLFETTFQKVVFDFFRSEFYEVEIENHFFEMKGWTKGGGVKRAHRIYLLVCP